MVHGSYNIKKEKICSKSAHVNTWSNGMKETDIIMRHDRGKRLAKLLMFSFVFFLSVILLALLGIYISVREDK